MSLGYIWFIVSFHIIEFLKFLCFYIGGGGGLSLDVFTYLESSSLISLYNYVMLFLFSLLISSLFILCC